MSTCLRCGAPARLRPDARELALGKIFWSCLGAGAHSGYLDVETGQPAVLAGAELARCLARVSVAESGHAARRLEATLRPALGPVVAVCRRCRVELPERPDGKPGSQPSYCAPCGQTVRREWKQRERERARERRRAFAEPIQRGRGRPRLVAS